MHDLNSLSDQQLQEFFNSIDYILCDVDGVLWNFLSTIPGTQEAIKALKTIGKKIILVSNNTTKSLIFYQKELQAAGFEIELDEIVTPTLSIVSYLKTQDLKDKEVFVLGMTALKNALKKEGFKLAENGPDRVEEHLSELVNQTLVDNSNVAAVVADVDINLNYVNLQKAASYLDNPEVLFLSGAPDCSLPTGGERVMIGPGYFTKILEDITKRQSILMAKPGDELNRYIVKTYNITDPNRVLFIGDSVLADMKFAYNGKYRKLLVLSGLTKREEVEKWEFPAEYKPEFIAESLKDVYDCIVRVFTSKL